jgi:hypothetical protein
MRHSLRILVLVMLALPAAASASMQARSAWFGAASFGPVMQDRHGNDLLSQSGFVVQARAGRRIGSSLSALVALTHTSVTRRYTAAVPMAAVLLLGRVPCPGGDPVPCGPDPFVGPVKAVIAGAGVEASAGSAGARVFASVAPGVYWLYERAPGARATSAGVGFGAGGSVRLMEPVWLVLDFNYHQIFGSGPGPRWLVPIGLGIKVGD